MGSNTSSKIPLSVPVVGIDLGTANSCVGVSQNGKIEIIANGHGYRKTPSYVAFTDREHLVGGEAKNQAAVNPTNTVFGVKRLIGCRFNDEAVQNDMCRLPFKVVNSSEKCKIEVRCFGKTKQFTPEEISSMVLLKMKKTAETYLGERVANAVITVPAHFNASQRKATINAGKIAGLNVMRIISEPMAAALAYGLGKRVNWRRNVLVVDLGGGTFDASIISIENEKFEVKAVGGDTHLGGCDFDSRLVDYCVKTFKQEHGGVDLTNNAKAISRLRMACEKAKRTLSLLECASIDVQSLHGDIDFTVSITRHQFEQLCSDLFDRMLAIVHNALDDAKLGENDVHEILLVGGSTRILRVQCLLQACFSDSNFNKSINPDEAVAYGATLLASILNNEQPLTLLEVTPISLNLMTPDGAKTMLVERNMKIPIKRVTMVPITSSGNGRDNLLRVYGSGPAITNESNLIDEFCVSGIPPSPYGPPPIRVAFVIDENGVLTVSKAHKSFGMNINVSFRDMGHLSEKEINQMIIEAQRLEQENERQRSKMAARIKLEKYIFTMQAEIGKEEVRQKTSQEQRESLLKMCETTLKWIDFDQDATKETYEVMHKRVKSACKPIMAGQKPDLCARRF